MSANVACSGQKPDGALIDYNASARVTTQDSLGFTCKRNSTPQTGGSSIFDEGTITVVTNYGNYDIFLPRDTKLSENMASAIAEKIGTLQKTLEALSRRISGIKLVSSDRAILPEFACSGEAITAEENTFMVGSRDGTGCGVLNRNYVKHLSLSIPDAQ
jgi:hypothetical protein